MAAAVRGLPTSLLGSDAARLYSVLQQCPERLYVRGKPAPWRYLQEILLTEGGVAVWVAQRQLEQPWLSCPIVLAYLSAQAYIVEDADGDMDLAKSRLQNVMDVIKRRRDASDATARYSKPGVA